MSYKKDLSTFLSWLLFHTWLIIYGIETDDRSEIVRTVVRGMQKGGNEHASFQSIRAAYA